jgi:hypothetical protein
MGWTARRRLRENPALSDREKRERDKKIDDSGTNERGQPGRETGPPAIYYTTIAVSDIRTVFSPSSVNSDETSQH